MHMLAHCLCEGKHTVTQLLCSAGKQQQDWSADYRLYQSHIDYASLFQPILRDIQATLSPGQPLILAVDDSNFGKRGRKIPTTGWIRDPLGPGFQTNLKWGQRCVQVSAAIAPQGQEDQTRMIPVQVSFMDKIPKLSKNATLEDIQTDQRKRADNSPSARALNILSWIQEHLPVQPSGAIRPIILLGDGGYTTARLLQNLPSGVTYIGRSRGDMHLNEVPDLPKRKSVGRPLAYGPKLPTPEELRKDKSIPWISNTVSKRGKPIAIRYKSLPRVKWTKAGENIVGQLVVVAPLRFKKKKNEPWHYTKPTYLMCTNTSMTATQIIQTYLLRWDIEVNFKEEKQLFGAGQAQVRHPQSVKSAPALTIAAYAAIHLAGIQTYGKNKMPDSVSPPKWRKETTIQRLSTKDLLQQLKFEAHMELFNFSHFAPPSKQMRSPKKKATDKKGRSSPL